jgi:hypothetical protein
MVAVDAPLHVTFVNDTGIAMARVRATVTSEYEFALRQHPFATPVPPR